MKKIFHILFAFLATTLAGLANGLDYINLGSDFATETKQNVEIGYVHLLNSALVNSDFAGSSISTGYKSSVRGETSFRIDAIYLHADTEGNARTIISNTSFKGFTVDIDNGIGSASDTDGGNKHILTTSFLGLSGDLNLQPIAVGNVDFSNAEISLKNSRDLSVIYSVYAIIDGLNMQGSKISLGGKAFASNIFHFESSDIKTLNLKNTTITCDSAEISPFAILINQESDRKTHFTKICDVDLRGAKVNGELISKKDFHLVGNGKASIKNIIFGENKIYSCGDIVWTGTDDADFINLSAENVGLYIRAEDDALTIDDGEAILDVSSNIKNGELILKNGGLLLIADDTILTFDAAIKIIVDREKMDLSEIFSFGDGAKIRVAGAKAQDEAYQMLLEMIKFDQYEELPTTITDINNLSQHISIIPEAADWAAVLGATALTLAALKRRKA